MENISDLDKPENITQVYKLRKKLAKDLLVNKEGCPKDKRKDLIKEERSTISDSINRINSGEEPIEVISIIKKYPTPNKTCNAFEEKLVKKDHDLITQVLQKELNKRK